MLAHHGLWSAHIFDGKSGALDYIRRVGCIQFDPLNIVGRNPDLVLQSRVANYRPTMLEELLYTDRALVDGFDKMMAIYPVEDWPHFRRHRESARSRYTGSAELMKVLPLVRKQIEERGPLSSKDLDYNQTIDWPWAPTRLARAILESMYFWGELVIHHKVHTRKLYDFAHNHISQSLLTAPDPNLTQEEYHDWYVLRRIGSIGLLWDKPGEAWLGVPGLKSKERNAAISRLTKHGRIIEIRIEGIEPSFYIRSEDMKLLDHTNLSDMPTRAAILAPLDNMLWDRRLAKTLFDLDYKWEVYKPLNERRYGYYVLPVLHGDRFVARFEPGRDKKTGALIVKNWWWETDVIQSESLLIDVRRCLKQFLRYLGTDDIQIHDPTAKHLG